MKVTKVINKGTLARMECSASRLEFIKYSQFWGGPTGTMVPTANAHIWGVIWRLDKHDSDALEEQKGVQFKKYFAKDVNVVTPHMGAFNCRSYAQKVNPLPRGDNDEIPVERWPSWTYKEIIILGAIEQELPEYYINDLRKIKHNAEEGCFRMICLLERYGTNKPCECFVPGRIPRAPLKLDLKPRREQKNKVKKSLKL